MSKAPTRGTPVEMKAVMKFFKPVSPPGVMKFIRPFPTATADGSVLNAPDVIKVTEYRPPETEPDPQMKGNLMGLTFPPPLSDKELFSDLYKSIQPFYEGFFDQPLEARELKLARMNDSCHYPFPMDLQVTRRAHGVMRHSLMLRDTRQPRVIRALLAGSEGRNAQLPRLADSGGGGGTGLLLCGISGVGKSSIVDRLIYHFGNFGRFHSVLNGEPTQWPQLGVIRVNVGPTWKATQERILSESNRQVGADINPFKDRSTFQLENDVPDALSRGLAPMLIIDELNQLNLKSQSAEARRIVRGLNDLMTSWGIPVMLVGAMSVRQLLLQFPQEMSRYTVGGDMLLDRLMRFDGDADNFIYLLRAHSISKQLPRYSDTFNSDLWAHCMGVRRVMVEYMRVVLKRHAYDESIRPNKQLLWSIAGDEMRCFEDTLSLLRKVVLGMQLSYRDCQTYENYFDVAVDQLPTEAQFKLDAKWRTANPNSKSGEGARLDAKEFEQLQTELARDEAAVKERETSKGVEAGVQPGVGRVAGRKAKKNSLQQASQAVKNAAGVLPLTTAVSSKSAESLGIDSGDIR